MATVYWTCTTCKRRNQRRGINHPTEQVRLFCSGCGQAHYVTIYWHEQRNFIPLNTRAKKTN